MMGCTCVQCNHQTHLSRLNSLEHRVFDNTATWSRHDFYSLGGAIELNKSCAGLSVNIVEATLHNFEEVVHRQTEPDSRCKFPL